MSFLLRAKKSNNSAMPFLRSRSSAKTSRKASATFLNYEVEVHFGEEPMKKAQAGLDFLMTYGWALLLIVLIVGALFALGIFDVGSFLGSRSSGFAQVGITGWALAEDGTFTAMFENHAGSDISISSITATMGTQTVNYTTATPLSNGASTGTLTLGTFSSPGTAGTSYTVEIDMVYSDSATGFNYADSGTVTGTVTP